MKNRITIICLLLSICFSLISQTYDEVKVLTQQATQYMRAKQFNRAESIWKELIEKHQDNPEVVKGAFNFYLSLNKRAEAKAILDNYGDAIPSKDLYKAKINYYIIAGNFKEAGKVTDSLFAEYKNNMNLYREIARIFIAGKQYDKAVEIINKARKVANDDYLFAMDMATAYRESDKINEAVKEYIILTKTNASYFYTSKRFLLEMLKKDSGVIDAMEVELEDEKDTKILEIYAAALMQTELYEKALEVYKKLDPSRLLYFANDQYRKGNYEVAILAYEALDKMKLNPTVAADAKVNRARCNLSLYKLNEAERLLKEITEDKVLQSDSYRYRSHANREAREILATLALYKGEGKEIVLSHFEEAKKFALNGKNRNDVEEKIIYHEILFGEFEQAKKRLSNLLSNVEDGTDTFKESFYYGYLIALNTQDPLADSLLTELVILTPQTSNVNDAIYLADISGKLNPDDFKVFMQAWRENKLIRPELAVGTYSSLLGEKPNEEVLLAIADSYIQYGQVELAKEIYEREYEDAVLSQYARLQLVNLSESDPDLRYQMIIDFLNNNQGSAFAPEFRRILSEN